MSLGLIAITALLILLNHAAGFGWTAPPAASSVRIFAVGGQTQPRTFCPQQQRRRTALLDSHENNQESSEKQQPHHAHRRNVTAVVEKKIRLAQAQAEIDRILQGPDAPLDLEHEMKKVIHIAPLHPSLMQPSASVVEQELDDKESNLELDLYQAVKQQEYAKAAGLKRELNQMHMDDCGAVLQVNSLFYRAFSEKNLKDMEALWWKDATSTCIHPSCKPLVGYKQVCDSWKRMFDATGSFQRTWMEPHNIRISVKGATMAIISCDEHVYLRRFVRGQKRQTELINKLTATNIFRKLGGRWYMIHHHASWHQDSEVSKMALRQRTSSPLLLSNKNNKNSPRMLFNQGSSSSFTARLRGLDTGGGGRGDHDHESSSSSIGMDGILGMSNYGPLLGSSDKNNQQHKNKPVKRIFMGSLNDILNGQLGDMLGSSSSMNGADSDDENDGGAIISFGRIEDTDDDDDDDDDLLDLEDEDDDEEEEEDDSNNDEEENIGSKAVSIIKQELAKASAADNSNSNNKSKVNNVSGAPKDALRQNCISALRRLCNQGSISQKQKRVLLTDIISCSAKGEFSMVEVAFELLCGEAGGGDVDVAEEEFADQCRVFALSLPEAPHPPK